MKWGLPAAWGLQAVLLEFLLLPAGMDLHLCNDWSQPCTLTRDPFIEPQQNAWCSFLSDTRYNMRYLNGFRLISVRQQDQDQRDNRVPQHYSTKFLQ